MNTGQDRQMQMVGAMMGVRLDSMLGKMQEIRIGTMQGRLQGIRGLGHYASNCTVRSRRRDGTYLQTQLDQLRYTIRIIVMIMRYLIAAAGDIDEIEEDNANCILMANLQQASTSSTQTNKAPVYDLDGSTEETHAYFESLNNNLAIEVEKVNTVNRKIKEVNADLTTKLARYKV
ncbi:hypothetical protein Tco_0977018 [Tanacetum coccineum]|uniref:Uncharacterized protein n=1 Tax=Tanacetum coccineum TaxID=301880 RepID=A0ABQ5EIV6_9ASTR